MINIVNSRDRTVSAYVNAIIYGPSGVGKTVLAATAPDVLIVSAEDGLLSIADEDVDTTDIRSLKELIEVYNYLANEDHNHKTVVIDSLSEIAQVLLVDFAAVERDKRQAYMKMADEMLGIVRRFRRLPMNVVLNAKQARIVDEFSGKTSFGPKFPGRVLENEIAYQLDEVLAMRFHKHEGVEYRVLQTAPDIQYEAKDRSGQLAKLEKPNLTAIFDKILKRDSVEETA